MSLSDNEDIDQFLNDPGFRRWVTQPTESLDRYWISYIESNPEKQEVLWQARETLQALFDETLPISPLRAEQNVQRILNRTTENRSAGNRLRWFSVAATVLLIAALGIYSRQTSLNMTGVSNPETVINPDKTAAEWITYTNNKQIATAVILPDGSTAVVFPTSSIRYPTQFSDSVRRVSLTGEAFFEVSKDAGHPFIVSTSHLNTRVLGTSFRIKDVKDQAPSVKVKTGSVFVALKQAASGSFAAEGKKFVLKAREEITFLEKGQDAAPAQDMLLPIETSGYSYKRTAVSEVFRTLSEIYGIEIHYDRNSLRTCTLTATLEDQPLPEKLRMICLGLNLAFEFNPDHSVTITGKGCK